MKRIFIILLAFTIFTNSNSQEFTCESLSNDITQWNNLAAKYKSNNKKWAEAILKEKLYNFNSDGSFEETFIFESNDSVNIETLKDLTINFFEYYFNLNNESRADLEIISNNSGVNFSGTIKKVGEFTGLYVYNLVNAKIRFSIRFKPNKIKFAVKIESYHVVKSSTSGIIQNKIVYVNECYPINEQSDHKQSYAMAFINSNSQLTNWAVKYKDYINKHLKEKNEVEEDW